MNAIDWMVGTPAAQALGWAVAHSVWQGAAVALALTAALALTRSARVRYAMACGALAAMLLAFGYTFAHSVPAALPAMQTSSANLWRTSAGAGTPRTLPESPLSAYLPWLAPFWAAGVLACQIRALAGWTSARRMRSIGVCAAPPEWKIRLDGLRTRLKVAPPVVLLESGLAKVPVVTGHLRPMILIPAGLLAGLPSAQVEAVLLHELAHVRRRDFLVNLLQMWMEALLFYHPATWWISSVIRAEREHCCDDLVVAIQGDPRGYATALAALEQHRSSAEPAMAATGGNLVKRIRRLLNQPEGPRPAFGPIFSATLLTLAAAGALIAWQARAPEPPAASPYAKWVQEDVAYIIDDRERAAFASLRTDEEREKFIEQFWQRRDPTPGTAANEYKEEHYRRIAYVIERFSSPTVAGWKSDRGRLYIMNGPPDEIESHPTGKPQADYPYEEWRYKWIEGVGRNVIVRFEDRSRAGEYRQTTDPRAIRK
jgi:GWxTD domain-containing protein